jgi:hypothetical protein
MKHFVIFIFIFWASWTASAQVRYDADLHSPVDIPILLAANFGELRKNHFHTGLDIKTNGQEGYKLYAIADGYVSRVQISPFGYGKVVYVTHPELGITSVYAHCQKFIGNVADFVLAEQQKVAFFEIERYAEPHEVPVKKGQVIALSGNTGSSTAPHLHFEIRETDSERPINPLLFPLFNVADSRPPEIRGIKVYAVSQFGYRIPGKEKVVSVTPSNGKYLISGNKVTIPSHFCSESGGVGLAFRVIDRYDGAHNICGLYEGHLEVGTDTTYRQRMAMLDFAYNRQINTHKDYEDFKYKGVGYEKYFRTPHNLLPIYPNTGNGILGFFPNNTYPIRYSAFDFAGNLSALTFELSVLDGVLRNEDTPYDRYDPSYMYPDSVYHFSGADYQILFRDFLLYEPVPKKLIHHSGKLTFGDPRTPLDGFFTVRMKLPENVSVPEKALVVVNQGSQKPLGGTVKDGWIETKSRDFGVFQVVVDSVPPVISPRNFTPGGSMSGRNLLTMSISDGLAGLAYYGLFINGEYVVLEFEPKSTQHFASVKDLAPGKYELKIVARDKVGNETIKEFTLTR